MAESASRQASKILLSSMAVVLWKFTIVCAFSGILLDFSGQSLRPTPLAGECTCQPAAQSTLRTELVTSRPAFSTWHLAVAFRPQAGPLLCGKCQISGRHAL